MNIQSFNFDNISVAFRNDGYLHATQIAKHFGKLPKDYLKTDQTQQYIAALAENCVRRKILTDKNQLVIIKQGGMEQGTWLHPKLAIHFARWLDPRFAVWCDEQIEQIMKGYLKLETAPPVVLAYNFIQSALAGFLLLVLKGWGMMCVLSLLIAASVSANAVFCCLLFAHHAP